MAFPATRMRSSASDRSPSRPTRETELSPSHLIQPLFVTAGSESARTIQSMPGVQRLSIAALVEEAGRVRDAGIHAVLLFGIPADKDEIGPGRLRRRGRRPDGGPGAQGGRTRS